MSMGYVGRSGSLQFVGAGAHQLELIDGAQDGTAQLVRGDVRGLGLGVLLHFEEGVAENLDEGCGFGLHGELDAKFCAGVCWVGGERWISSCDAGTVMNGGSRHVG